MLGSLVLVQHLGRQRLDISAYTCSFYTRPRAKRLPLAGTSPNWQPCLRDL
jgi:hypothetical protein